MSVHPGETRRSPHEALAAGAALTRGARAATGPAGLALFALLALVLLAVPRPLMLPDEGRYAGVAWEMLRSGQWQVPTLDGLPYFHKPPLFYWITAASMALFGPGELPARAAPILGAWAAAVAIHRFLHRWWGERPARLAFGVLLVQPLFTLGGQFANLDMLVAGCITVTIVLLAHAALQAMQAPQGRVPTAPLLGAYLAAALGVLAKGLIGAVLPLLVVATWLALLRRWRVLLGLLSLPGLALFLLVAAPWFVAMQHRFPDFLHYFFVVQHLQRFAGGGFNNVQPAWFFPVVLLLQALPWLPWLRPLYARAEHAEAARADLRWLMRVWLAVVVLFFSLPASKLLGYVLPAVPPLAVLLAEGLDLAIRARPRAARRAWLCAGLALGTSLAVVGVLAVRTPHSTKELGRVLGQLRRPGEPVFMLEDYAFDLPLYARLTEPVGVVLDWSDPRIRQRDTWRKELADAGDFDPDTTGERLLSPAQLASALCRRPLGWVVGPTGAAAGQPLLAAAEAVRSDAGRTLWRIDRARAPLSAVLNCPGTPSGG